MRSRPCCQRQAVPTRAALGEYCRFCGRDSSGGLSKSTISDRTSSLSNSFCSMITNSSCPWFPPMLHTAVGPPPPKARGNSNSKQVVMRPLGDPPSTSNPASPLSSMEERQLSNGAASTPYSSNGANSNTGLVLARRNVSTLTAVQTAAAGASSALQSREQLADIVVADVRVSPRCVCRQAPAWAHGS